MKDLNITIDLIPSDIFRTLQPIPKEYTFYSTANGIFTNIDTEMGHKTSIQKKKYEISIPL